LAASDSIRIGIKVAGKGRGADKKNYFYFWEHGQSIPNSRQIFLANIQRYVSLWLKSRLSPRGRITSTSALRNNKPLAREARSTRHELRISERRSTSSFSFVVVHCEKQGDHVVTWENQGNHWYWFVMTPALPTVPGLQTNLVLKNGVF
jgi:hypothetical protein